MVRAKIPPIVGIDGRSLRRLLGSGHVRDPGRPQRAPQRPRRGRRDRAGSVGVAAAGEMRSPSPTRPTTRPAAAPSSDGNDDQAAPAVGPQHGGMTVATDTFADFVDHLAEALDDHEMTGEEWAAPAALLALPLRPDDQVRRRRAAAGLPAADPAGAGGVPDDHHLRPADRHRGRGRLRLARGVHPGLHQGVRRGAARPGAEARAHPDRRAERRALPPTRQPPAAGTRQGDRHGPADEDGRAPRLADRRDGRASPSGSPTSSSTSRSSSTSTTTSRRSARCCPGWSARWACGTPRWPPATTTGRSRSTSRCRRCASGSRPRARRTSPTSATSSPHDRLDDTFVDALCEPAEVFTYGGMIAHVLTFAAHRRTLVALAFGRHGSTSSAGATPCSGWPQPA